MTAVFEKTVQLSLPPVEETERLAHQTLALNDRGQYTAPHTVNYPHQWLWDSAFHAVGLRHATPDRAATELLSLERGQWQNGMIPNIIMAPGTRDYMIHLSARGNHGNAPNDLRTSGITQPPLLADAGRLVGEKLSEDDRTDFYRRLVPMLSRYHQWIYRERDFAGEGLFAAVHPWETGMDNTPPWMQFMRTVDWGSDGRLVGAAARARLLQRQRRDITLVDAEERSSATESGLQMQAQWSLIKNRYQAARLRDNHPLHVQDVLMNSALVRGNRVLRQLAEEIGTPLDDELLSNMCRTEANFEKLWSEQDGQYLARDAVSGRHLRSSTISSLIALYSGIVPPDRAQQLVSRNLSLGRLRLEAGLATVPADDPAYSEKGYWGGAEWMSTTWLATEGLERSGFVEQADDSRRSASSTIALNGMHEYFSARTGQGYGVNKFSWTAALYLDFTARLQQRQSR